MLDFLAHTVDGAYLSEHGEGAGIIELTHSSVLLTSIGLSMDRRQTYLLPDDEFMALPVWEPV